MLSKGLKCIGVVLLLVGSGLRAESVTDSLGNQLDTHPPAQRIVTLSPHSTELLFSLGVGDRIVATVSYSDYPEQANAIPRIGQIEHTGIESILHQQPDLVVAWAGGNSAHLLDQLVDFGIRVYHTSSQDLASIERSLADLGKLTGTYTVAEQLITAHQQRLAELRNRYSHQAPVTVFYQLWTSPLMTANNQQIMDEMIRVCGGVNLFADRPEVVPQTSVEAVVLLNPDVIIAPTQGTPADWQTVWLQWPEMSAARNKHLYTLNADLISRPTLRVTEGIARLCERLARVRSDHSDS